ncbi:hypothetical protein AYI69_g4831 [Smittium culicis]|uniref:Magnesium transporter NIPA8 n=1 Tax=Smittium culicis TaxID=133412 RepID=A0A1R1YAI2_9FUNG|nr:hypothetical protein AYI69_g4831 [Smittium culicis]
MFFSNTILGVIYSLIGSFGHSFGLTLQRKAHIQRQKVAFSSNSQENMQSRISSLPPIYTNFLWLSGFTIFIVSSSVFPALALVYLPVFVTAPLSSVNLAANTICAGWVLNFKISLKDYRDTIIVTFGAIWIAIFAAIEEKERSLNDLIQLYTRPVFIIYFLIYQIILCALIFAELYLRKRYRHFRSKLSDSESSPLMIQDSMHDLEDSLSKNNLNTNSNNTTPNRDSFSVDIDEMPSNLAGNHGPETEVLDTRCYQNEYLINKKNSTLIKNNGAISNSLKKISDVVESTPLLSNGEFVNNQDQSVNSLTHSPFDNENNPKMQVESILFAESSSSVTRADSEQLISSFNVANNDFVKNILKTENASGMLSGFISGLICSMSILFTKTSVELLSLTLKGDNQFRSPLSWFIVFSLVSAALGNVRYINFNSIKTDTFRI